MTKFEELVNDFTIMGDDGAVIFSSYDRFVEFIEEIVVDERKREREACAKVCENIERNGAWVGLTDEEREFFKGIGFVGVDIIEAKLKDKNA